MMSVLGMIGATLGLYKVVPTDEMHVRIMNNKREIFMSGKYQDKEMPSSYWIMPGVTKISKIPKTNLRIDVPDIKLNDSEMAKFQCDVVCFVRIVDPILASERTGITSSQDRFEGKVMGLETLASDFRAIMESISRTVATKQTILEIYTHREKLDAAITNEVEKVFPQWGLELVDMEINDLKDISGSTIISDIEKKKASEISAEARIKIAEQNSRAQIVEAEKLKEAEMKTAENQEIWLKRRIEKERTIAIAEADKTKQGADKLLEANESQIKAESKLTIGRADIDKEKVRIDAEAQASKIETEAKANAKKIQVEGEAQAGINLKLKLADAEGTLKNAEALAKYNEAGLELEKIKANKEIQLGYAKAQGDALSHAEIKIVAGSTQEIMSGGFFGNIKVGAKEGAAMQQFKDMGGVIPIGNAQNAIDTAIKVEGVKKLGETNGQ